MTKIFTKLRSLVDDALNERSPIIEQDTTLMAAPVERELFDHRILYIEEDAPCCVSKSLVNLFCNL